MFAHVAVQQTSITSQYHIRDNSVKRGQWRTILVYRPGEFVYKMQRIVNLSTSNCSVERLTSVFEFGPPA
jgi:hypothetical protein